jgi:hypothetical protein
MKLNSSLRNNRITPVKKSEGAAGSFGSPVKAHVPGARFARPRSKKGKHKELTAPTANDGEEVNDMLLDAIKAKLAILDSIDG